MNRLIFLAAASSGQPATRRTKRFFMELATVAQEIQEALDTLRDASYKKNDLLEQHLRNELNALLNPIGFSVTKDKRNIYYIAELRGIPTRQAQN